MSTVDRIHSHARGGAGPSTGCPPFAAAAPPLGEVYRHAAGLVAGEQLGRRAPSGLVLEIEVAERLSILVTDDEAGVVLLFDRPGRREAAHMGVMIAPFPLCAESDAQPS